VAGDGHTPYFERNGPGDFNSRSLVSNRVVELYDQIIIIARRAAWGRPLIACAAEFSRTRNHRQVDAGDDLSAVISKSDVVIDFSSHNATPGIL